jgi:hypothetical protein
VGGYVCATHSLPDSLLLLCPPPGRLTGDYDFSNADKFLNLPSTRKALGVGEREWEGCDAWIYEVRPRRRERRWGVNVFETGFRAAGAVVLHALRRV